MIVETSHIAYDNIRPEPRLDVTDEVETPCFICGRPIVFRWIGRNQFGPFNPDGSLHDGCGLLGVRDLPAVEVLR